MDHRSTVVTNYKKEHYASLHSKNDDPWGAAIFDPRSMVGRIYVELHMTLMHYKYITFGLCRFREDFFIYISSIIIWQITTSLGYGLYGPQGRERLTGFITRSTTHC